MPALKIPSFDIIEVDPETALLPLTVADAKTMYERINANSDTLSTFMPDWSGDSLAGVRDYCKEADRARKTGRIAAYKTVRREEYVGNVTLEVNPDIGMPEMLFWLAEEVQGHGLGKRVVRSVRDRYFEAGLEQIGTLINPRNPASRKVVKSAGAKLEDGILKPLYRFLPLPIIRRLDLDDEFWVIRNNAGSFSHAN